MITVEDDRLYWIRFYDDEDNEIFVARASAVHSKMYNDNFCFELIGDEQCYSEAEVEVLAPVEIPKF